MEVTVQSHYWSKKPSTLGYSQSSLASLVDFAGNCKTLRGVEERTLAQGLALLVEMLLDFGLQEVYLRLDFFYILS